jgi:ABC-type antimicrobial peptide transport system permease subunit
LSLISLSIENRKKEIGIRKVLGASIPSIVTLFMKEFLIVIALAGVIALPLSYLIMQSWLNDYVYRITLTGQPFIIALTGLASATAILIVLQTIKAAVANPVNSLRSE